MLSSVSDRTTLPKTISPQDGNSLKGHLKVSMNSGDNEPGKNPCPLHPLNHHHHHFFYVSPHCPFHGPISLPKNHSPSCSFSNSNPSSQYPVPVASIPAQANLSFSNFQTNETLDDPKNTEDLSVEDEEEPIFVLTDEWRDFFAKSEAKRRLAKAQAKKGKS